MRKRRIGGIGDDPMLVVEHHAEAAVGVDLVDQPLHDHQLFLRRVLGSVREVDGRGLAVLAGLELVAELLAFPERAKARPLDRGDVDEGVGAARFVGDEAVAPVGIEEFYGAGGHDLVLSENETARAQKARRGQ